MKEETIHYLVRFLKKNPSDDVRHAEALKELAGVQNSLLDNYRDVVLLKVEQPVMVHLMMERAVGTGPRVAAK